MKVKCEICEKEFSILNGKYVYKIKKYSKGVSMIHYSCGYNCFTKLNKILNKKDFKSGLVSMKKDYCKNCSMECCPLKKV